MSDQLTELVEFARANSPFYKQLYDGVPAGPVRLADLPIIDQSEFWAANTMHGNTALTGPHTDGIIFKTGGTTSAPRLSAYTRPEWKTLASTFATGLAAAGVRHGDRVANLLYAGELYSSFILMLNMLQMQQVDTVQLPIAGSAPADFKVQALQDFEATVIAAFPTALVALAQYVKENVGTLPHVRVVLFSGEAFYGDQRRIVHEAFPNAVIRSLGYGSVDGGVLGAPVEGCEDVRVFRAFEPTNVIEIVDTETGEPIVEPGRPGRLLVTDLGRRLQPMIRYPVGDLGEWVSFEERTFRLLGRADEGARVGPVTLHLDYLRGCVDTATGSRVDGFQVVLRRVDAKDQLVLRFASDATDRAAVLETLSAQVDEISPRFADHVARGIIQPLAVEWVTPSEIAVNPRTSKVLRLIDERPV
ncbi:phenylacetate-CoA ligase [Amycolatopsis xylanica]|uniref:Phenylacetate-CoA ligase n=1 Tax=Amycolatopsis xylanica TaxID=589385 RepID=A0A1H3QFE2_9PSEU|nr:AMP-binding protein [Amycolatopsis xylanica]SDZ11861.1 phenylacetate-CoA ligase [Amycolatopsis xylanica]